MKFGLFYQQQYPKPWAPEEESRAFNEHIDQAVLAEQLGFDSIWVTEHHYLEEYSHSSAPDVFLAAVAARTSKIRLGHGIRQTPPKTNIPARLAESAATLDLISRGRVEFGIGEGATKIELGAHNISPKEKRAMGLEAGEQIANMWTMTPYPGWKGEHFEIECRNVVPKPLQQPHPPMWMACTNRETIEVAASLGLGAMAFAFVDPSEAKQWSDTYYDIIRSDRCVPLGHSINPRFAMVSALSVADTREQAIREGYHCFNFFKKALTATLVEGTIPGHTDLWDHYIREEGGDAGMEQAIAEALAQSDDYIGAEGTPADIMRRMQAFEDAGVDDVIFLVQGGGRTHREICSTLEQFGKHVLPTYASRADARRAARLAELAPYVAEAMARKNAIPELKREDVPIIPPARMKIAVNEL